MTDAGMTDAGMPDAATRDGTLAPPDATAAPDLHFTKPDARVDLPDARPTADISVGPPDVRIAPPDAWIAPPDARIAPPDAHPALADGRVETPDVLVDPPDAIPPDASPPDAGPPCVPVAEQCNGADDDCDGRTDEIDPAEFPVPCVPDDVSQCGPTRWVCAAALTPVCVGAHASPDLEVCNGEDDDCDGVVDNGFDLESDVRNCGICGHSCDPLVHGRGLCVAAECLVRRCDDAFRDVDSDPSNGCETCIDGDVLYVRANGDDANPGTLAAPMATLAAANTRAGLPGDPSISTIDVGNGEFEGNLDLDTHFLTVRGAGRNATRINGRLLISGRYTRVQDLTIDAQAGPVGIHLTCPAGCAVVSTRITNVGPDSDPGEDGGPVAALRITAGQAHVISGNEIDGVTGYTPPLPSINEQRGCQWRHGSAAVGILLEGGATASRLIENDIDTVTGGAGTSPTRENCNGGSLGGLGGPAYGILLSDAAGHYTLVSNEIRRIQGGNGGNGQSGIPLNPADPNPTDADILRSADGNGGGGGLAAGIRIEGAGHRLRGNLLSTITGGRGGATGGVSAERGPDAEGFGLYFHPFLADNTPPPVDLFAELQPDEPALANDIDPSNVFELEPILFCFQQTVDWSGYRLRGTRTPTNLGRMVLIDCDGSTVRNNVIEGFVGATGRPSEDDAESVPGAEGAGIFLLGTADAVISGNHISGIRGGHGAQGAYDASFVAFLTAGGRGGHAAAIRLRGAERNQIFDNDLGDIVGGPGGNGGLAHGNGGPGGRAAGVEFVGGSRENLLLRNTIHDLSGGAGAPTDPFPLPRAFAPPGRAFGVSLADAESRNNHIDETNTYELLPFTYLYGQPGSVVSGRVYATCKAMTNLGQVVVLESERSRLSGIEITCTPGPGEVSDLIGEAGLPATSLHVGETGAAYVAVRVEGSEDTVIDGLRVDGVQGGPGGPPHIIVRGGDGGLGGALSVRNSGGFRLDNAHLSRIRSGVVAASQPPLPGTQPTRPGGLTADAIAIDLFESPASELNHLLIHDVYSDGHALGLFYTDAGSNNFVRQATLVGIHGENLGHGSDDPMYPNFTSGVLVQGARVNSHVLLDNLVMAEVSHRPVWALGGHQVDRTSVCFRGERQVFMTGSGLPSGPYFENPDPLFRADSEPPYGLDPASICVDLGVEACFDEPVPAGETCLSDLGYEGNSPRGQVRTP